MTSKFVSSPTGEPLPKFSITPPMFSSTSELISQISSDLDNPHSVLSKKTARKSGTTFKKNFALFLTLFESFTSPSSNDSIVIVHLSEVPLSHDVQSITRKIFTDPCFAFYRVSITLTNPTQYLLVLCGQTSQSTIFLATLHSRAPATLAFSDADLPDFTCLSSIGVDHFDRFFTESPVVSSLQARFLDHFQLCSAECISKFLSSEHPSTRFVYLDSTYISHFSYDLILKEDFVALAAHLIPPAVFLDTLSIAENTEVDDFIDLYSSSHSASDRHHFNLLWDEMLQDDKVRFPDIDFGDDTHSISSSIITDLHTLSPLPSPLPTRPLQLDSNSTSQSDMPTLMALFLQMNAASERREEAAAAREEASRAREETARIRSDNVLAQVLAIASSNTAYDPTPMVDLQHKFLLVTQSQMQQNSNAGKKGTHSTSAMLSSLEPLLPLFDGLDHLLRLLCQGENYAVALTQQLTSTSVIDLKSFSSFVHIDSFRKRLLELTYPNPYDESALRDIPVETLIGLLSLNFALNSDGHISITDFRNPSKKAAVAKFSFNSLRSNLYHFSRLAQQAFGAHLKIHFETFLARVETMCTENFSSIIIETVITAVNLRLANLRAAQVSLTHSSPIDSFPRLSDAIISATLSISHTDTDITQDVIKRLIASSKETPPPAPPGLLPKSGSSNPKPAGAAIPTPPMPWKPSYGSPPCFRWVNDHPQCSGSVCTQTRRDGKPNPHPHMYDVSGVIDQPGKDEFIKWVRAYRK